MNKPQGSGVRRRMKGFMLKHMRGMITCREFEDFVLQYLEGELSATQSRVFKMHLMLCRECREYLAAYERTMEISKSVFATPEEPLPDEVPEDLVKAILEARKN